MIIRALVVLAFVISTLAEAPTIRNDPEWWGPVVAFFGGSGL